MAKKMAEDIYVGAIFETKNFGSLEIIEIKNSENVIVQFKDTKTITSAKAGNIRRGEVGDKLKPSVHGVGFIGVGPHKGLKTSKAYQVWSDMLRRCYNPSCLNHAINWNDVVVDSCWHDFQNFANWYEDKIKIFDKNNVKGVLDKDLIIPGNRIYGPNVCCIVPCKINSALMNPDVKNQNLPLGVHKHQNGFMVRVNRKYVGFYPTIPDAQRAYWSEKFRVIQETAIRYWHYLPEPLAYRLLLFNWSDALAYYGDDARIWSE